MHLRSFVAATLLSFTVAAPVAQVSQITDGQVQAPTGTPVSQISDGQVQAATGTPVSQISDGQVQAATGAPVSQISDGQVQAATGTPVSQISDGQVQAATGAAVTQISDGQVQAATGAAVTQISDGQVQAPTGAAVTQISDGQVQAPTGAPVTQISDGQVQAPTGAPVTQISDGQVQAPTGAAVTQISDGQVQAPTGAVVTQISDGQVQAPPSNAGAVPVAYGQVAADQSGNVAGYSDADAPYASDGPTPLTAVPTSFGLNSQIPAIYTTAPTAGPGAADTLRSNINDLTQPTSHGPYSGEPTTIGAVTTVALGTAIAEIGPNPTATYYNTNGLLTHPEPIPYTPYGGLGTNGTTPRYMVNSDFDYESIQLGLYQEWIELDCFNNGLATFSEEDFLAAGLTSEDRELIRFMGQQEEGHASLLTNMIGETAVPQCTYNYPYTNVREFVDFNQILTRFGESGVWGFINHLDSREVGQLLAQSIATEARQQLLFRQMSGLTPMAVWFETGIPQSWAWTFLAPYISSCPENATRLAWQNFPALHVVNQANINRVSPNDTADWERVDNRTASPATLPPQDESCVNLNKTGYGCGPAIAHNRSEPLSFPGKQIRFLWDSPGQAVGPNNSYVTSTAAGAPKFVAWANQLNLTYTDLTITGVNEGYTYQPAGEVYQQGSGIVNDTAFVALTDTDMFLTPFNLSMINPHVVALGIYQAG